MKKMMSVFVMLAIVCGVSSSALSESRVAVIRNGEVFKVIYKSNELADVKVTISDSGGEKVFSEELISVNGFIRPYNFSDLPKGDYTICITDVEGEKTAKVCFDEGPYSKQKWSARIARLSSDQSKVVVSVPEHSSNDFSVQIFDNNDQLIYSEDQKTESAYAKVFNLKNLDQGGTVQLVNHVTGEIKYLRAE